METDKKNILIIDDNVDYLNSLNLFLKKYYNVSVARSYTEALEMLKNKTDVALIDIRLDEKDPDNADGLKILEWIKSNKPETSAFIMSAYKEFHYAEKSLNLGARHFFRKPIELDELKKILKEKS